MLDADRNRWWGYDDVGGLGGRVEERSFFDVAKRDFENRQAVNFAVRLDGKLIGEAVLYRFDCRGGAELAAGLTRHTPETDTAPRPSPLWRSGACTKSI